MIPREILKKVRLIELQTRKLVNDVFSGEYHSVFKGQGMEFSEVREYVFGDDVRNIDWNVTARNNHPYVKVYEEERELTVMLAVDASASGKFGSNQKFKSEIAAEISALLAFSAIRNNDKVGLLIFTDQIEKYIPPQKGRGHVLRVIREILYFQPHSRQTNIKAGIEHLLHGLKRNSIVFLLSDFEDQGYFTPLKILNKKHDTIAIHTVDKREKHIPDIGLVTFQDAESGEKITINTSDEESKQEYIQYIEAKRNRFIDRANKINLDHIEIDVSDSYIKPLINFFKMRERRLK
ncbi:MAG: DUF58 domain-containing protein [Candidatus Marinimicrobia bacterium]|nr:DUF58 domain-containing protein [Candidatus Neomarinimicrobiota bacterium]